ncbi:A1pp-domain-containing protein [Suillus clintonianus]|uniref:A1pp-domain-containing protein n=1 Tax=Suillus clintonianus TaxID=1904413 RepID=UPI001B86E680|nr:A1pp-domain-containing protein [Suillus clintonianus]KAG2147695.1 A1pp-domain-containing protein [Suillus clintonianus]
MPNRIQLQSIRTAGELFANAAIQDVDTAIYPPKRSLLSRVHLYQGDITEIEVDAIVNAANSTLQGGGGVDGAIHMAAGPALAKACRELYPGRHPCPTGDAKITPGFQLPSKHVIHAVGPRWSVSSDTQTIASQLASCYRISLQLAVDNNCKSIAFPLISTGIYGYPIDEATHIALKETRIFLDGNDQLDHVVFVIFTGRNGDQKVYEKFIPYYFPFGPGDVAESVEPLSGAKDSVDE